MIGAGSLVGKTVLGMYLGQFAVSGTVLMSYEQYGGPMRHEIALDAPIGVYGEIRDRVLLVAPEVLQIL